MTARPHAHGRLRRALERRALWLAEDAARELPNLALEDALQLVHLYAERGSTKYEWAATRWLVQYRAESSLRSLGRDPQERGNLTRGQEPITESARLVT